jgi:hypothetical protein
LEKLSYLPSQATVRYTSEFNPAIGNTLKTWDARDFIAAASLFIPPQPSTATVAESACRSLGRQPFRKKRREPAWARLIAKIYDVDLLGGSSARSALREPVGRSKIGRPPPGLDPAILN